MKNKDNNSPKVKQRLLLPIISLIFCLTPILLWGLAFFFNAMGISFIAYAIWVLLLASLLGIFFYMVGALLGVIYIVSQVFQILLKKKQINIRGLILAIFSAVLSSVLLVIFGRIFGQGP